MNEKNTKRAEFIQSILDDNSVIYAHAYLTKPNYGYAHMHIDIHLQGKNYLSRPDGVVRVSCQIGGEGEFSQRPYAENVGYDRRYGDGSLEELEQAVKVMRKIQKKLDELYDQLGQPTCFADFAQRCLLGSGAKWLIANPHNWTNGALDPEQMEAFTIGSESRRRLDQMEQELITVFARKTA